jgi:hypothetical protein
MDSDRARYVESLKTERAALAGRQPSPNQQRRLAEVDALIDSYSEKPQVRQIETRTRTRKS